ncbi:MAG: carboxylesterase/lipase family protein [Rhodopila sp.]|nr:carboxylesterase/lipase family protein [Rhodopila sp.]
MRTGRRSLLGFAALGLARKSLAAPRPEGKKAAPPPNVTVETHRGKVRGGLDDGIKVFKGIPYAATTDGLNRFRAPKPAKSWTDIRDVVAYGPMCPQVGRERGSYAASWTYDKDASEDCLVLNVWTPALRDQRKRPVMVWLHGGGFSAGSGSRNVFEGTRLCQRGDVVVVTLNHRLNVFGFLYLGHLGGAEYAESGNAGMLDLVAALRWVHDNISAFGGDPANVTIFGQSGGAAKVSTLMAMPQARGLFHKAIVQSGSHLEGLTPDEATRHALTFLAALDVKPTELQRLAKLPTDKLVAALNKVMDSPGAKPNFSPVVDGIVLPKGPWQPDGPAVSAGIPMIIGSTRTETTALLGANHPDYFALDDTSLHRNLVGWIPERDVPRVIAGFRRLMPSASASDLFFAITTDRRVRQQAWAQAERKVAQGSAPVWLYELDWATPVDGGKWGSPHSLDLAFVFDNVAKSEAMVGTGPDPQQLADQMSAAWIAFARTGNPNTGGVPTWPPFSSAERPTMVFNTTSHVANDFRGDERAMLASFPIYKVTR